MRLKKAHDHFLPKDDPLTQHRKKTRLSFMSDTDNDFDRQRLDSYSSSLLWWIWKCKPFIDGFEIVYYSCVALKDTLGKPTLLWYSRKLVVEICFHALVTLIQLFCSLVFLLQCFLCQVLNDGHLNDNSTQGKQNMTQNFSKTQQEIMQKQQNPRDVLFLLHNDCDNRCDEREQVLLWRHDRNLIPVSFSLCVSRLQILEWLLCLWRGEHSKYWNNNGTRCEQENHKRITRESQGAKQAM